MVYVDSIGAGGGSIALPRRVGRPAGRSAVRGRRIRARRATAAAAPSRRSPTPTSRSASSTPTTSCTVRPALDRDAAETAIAHRRRAARSRRVHEAAAGICRIVDSKMADLLRRMSVLRGLDPREFTCFAYGGMGPVHAAAVAREVGMKRLVIPLPHIAPVWSAFGATVADVVHVYQRPQRLVMPVAAGDARVDVRRARADAAATCCAVRGLRRRSRRAAALAAHALRRAGVRRRGPARGRRVARRRRHRRGVRRRSTRRCTARAPGTPRGGIAITALDRPRPRPDRAARRSPPRRRPPTRNGARAPSTGTSTASSSTRRCSRLREGGLDERLEGPLLIELPDTVVVVRPGQTARFGDLGTLTIDL